MTMKSKKKKKKKKMLKLPRNFLWSMLILIKIGVFNPEFSSDFRDAMITAIINCLTSLLAGFVVFAVLGYMAHIRESTVEALALQGKLGYMSRRMTKPTKWHVLPANTQISLGIRPVWSESSLSAWRKLVSLATHECTAKTLIRLGGCPGWSLWSDWADVQADLNLCWAHMPYCWFCHEAAHLLWWRNLKGC